MDRTVAVDNSDIKRMLLRFNMKEQFFKFKRTEISAMYIMTVLQFKSRIESKFPSAKKHRM